MTWRNETETTQRVPPSEDAQNKRILIAEDSPTQAVRLQGLLETHGYQVAVAADGREGLAAAREWKPDLIIADILMPVMDGYEMCQAKREDDALWDIPIMLLTVATDPKDIVRALQSGADHYLTKPYSEDYLLSRVQAAFAAPTRGGGEPTEPGLEITQGGERPADAE